MVLIEEIDDATAITPAGGKKPRIDANKIAKTDFLQEGYLFIKKFIF